MESQSDLLQKIVDSQKDMSVKFAQLSADFSIYKNTQEPINVKVLSILNNDSGSSRKGLIDQVDSNTEEIFGIKTREKVLVGQKYVLAGVTGAIGGGFLYIVNLFI